MQGNGLRGKSRLTGIFVDLKVFETLRSEKRRKFTSPAFYQQKTVNCYKFSRYVCAFAINKSVYYNLDLKVFETLRSENDKIQMEKPILTQGKYYHIFNKGRQGENLFKEIENYSYF